jgi:hypothetical protein
MAGGRPLKFKSVKELDLKIKAYFEECDEEEQPYTITGLALALGTYRQTLINYEHKDEFMDTIKTAKQKVENYAERRLFESSPTGAIFALKNFGWRDKQELEHSGEMTTVEKINYYTPNGDKPKTDTETA